MSKSHAYLYKVNATPAPKLAKIFAALSSPSRIRILRNVARLGTYGGDKYRHGPGCTITAAGLGLKLGLPTLSHHIQELAKAGLLVVERKGREKRCWAITKARNEIESFLKSLGPKKWRMPTKEEDEEMDRLAEQYYEERDAREAQKLLRKSKA